jgi:hypothetical protein
MRRRIGLVIGVAVAMLLALVGIGTASSSATPAPTALTTCNGTYDGVTFNALIVPAWGSCIISNSVVHGSVTVNKNAEFDACDVTVAGSVGATQAYVNIDNSSWIGGSITLNQPGSPLSVGGSPCTEKGTYDYSSYICPHYVGGSVNVTNAPYNSYLEVSIGECGAMTIHGGVLIQNNRQLVEIEDATIVGSLLCLNNWPQAQAWDVTVGGARVGCYGNTCT